MKGTPEEIAAQLNQAKGGFNEAMGLTFISASPDEIVANWRVGRQHLQPYGIVHGGVHCGVIETLCSAGAAISVMETGHTVVGLENHTSFIRAAREGTLTVRAVPIQRGRRAQVWEANITDEQSRLIATGRVRLLCLEPEAALAGSKVEVQG